MSTHRRRLSAILHADLTGSVRLMEGAEDQTVSHLKSVREEIWRPAIVTGGGSVVDFAGDSVLAEFESAMASVATAIDIQERMARFNDMLDEDRRLLFRIGLHLGEVIVDEETKAIYGDGVNIAARIQALAEPGGIAVSRSLRDVTELNVEHDFIDGGEHQAKNVGRPLRIFHVRPRAGSSTGTTTSVVPDRVLRFQGTDKSRRKYAFAVNLNKLMGRGQGVVIGRDVDQCDVVLAHPTVSRRHARLSLAGGVLQVEDLGSTNGTEVDGKPALPGGKRRSLQAGATLKIGEITLAVGSD